MTISSSARALVKMPSTNSAIGIVRSPDGPRATTSAPVASSTEFQSPSGSQWATAPHSVPRLRTSGSATQGAAAVDRPEGEVGGDHVGVADERPDPEMPVVALDAVEARDPVDVDQLRRAGQAHLHHRQQALAAREDPSVVTAGGLGRDRPRRSSRAAT